MNRTLISLCTLVALGIGTTLFTGCQLRNPADLTSLEPAEPPVVPVPEESAEPGEPGEAATPSPTPEPSPSPSPTPTMYFTDGWTNIKIEMGYLGGYAKIDINDSGHFTTSYNRCWQEEAGAIVLQQWNVLTKATNDALAESAPRTLPTPGSWYPYPDASPSVTPSSDPALCLSSEGYYLNNGRGVDGDVSLVLKNGSKRVLFETVSGRTCTTIRDVNTANTLLDALDAIVIGVEMEGCTGAEPRVVASPTPRFT